MVMGSQVAGGIGGGGTGGGGSGGGTGGGGGLGEEGGPLSVEIIDGEATTLFANVSGGVEPYAYEWTVISGDLTCGPPDDEVVCEVTVNSGLAGTVQLLVTDDNAQTATDTHDVSI